MVSTSGSQLLAHEAVRELRESLLSLTTILTPNVPEARLILKDAGQEVREPQSVEELVNLAKLLQSLGPKYVLVKGGHLPFTKDGSVAQSDAQKAIVIDVLYGEGEVTKIETIYQRTKNTHGTGCSLACGFNLNEHKVPTDVVMYSCHCIQSGQWTTYGPGSEICMSIY